MDVFDLYARISLDSKNYETGLNKAKGSFDGFKTHLGDALKTVAKLTTAAVTAGAAATGKVIKDAVANYGEYEQLVGGIETLFKDSAGTVQANAEKAFSTAQISANQYMDLVTSFSASLIQSTGRGIQTNLSDLKESQKEQLKATKQTYADELKAEKARWDAKIKLADKSQKESLRNQKDAAIDSLKKQQTERLALLEKSNKKALEDAEKANSKSTTSAQSLEKAAKLSDLAVIDMADNANKMGTNMESIQNAYQGFAKQNYTMLDNLKLGYGGTKEEMERLLKDADALNAKQGKVTKYSINSFADIVEAIHVVQQNLGITGTSAEEAGTTIQGSLASVKAAWQDTLTAMGSGKDLDKRLDNLTKSVKKYGENMKPILRQALKGAVSAIGELAPSVAAELPKLVVELAPDVIRAGADIAGSLVSGIYNEIANSNIDEGAKNLTEKINQVISNADAKGSGEKFALVVNKVIGAGFNTIETFDFKEAATKLTTWFNSAVNNINWGKLGKTVGDAWKGVWDFIGTSIETIDWENVGEKISEFINAIDWGGILTSMFKVIGGIIKNMPELLKGVIENLDFDNAASAFALWYGPKMAKKLLNHFQTDGSTKKTLTDAGTEAGKTIGTGVEGQGNKIGSGLGSKLKAGFEAFAVGWTIGTWIYNQFKSQFDAAGEALGHSMADGIRDQIEDIIETTNYDTQVKIGKKYEALGYKIDYSNSVSLERSINDARTKHLAQQSSWTPNLVGGSTSSTPPRINSAADYKIYIDSGKLVGGTSKAYSSASANAYNYVTKGYSR